MVEGLYNKAITCPVCSKDLVVTKVQSKVCRISSKDTDFCLYYEGVNPIFYDVWVCEFCGHAAQADKFEKITYKEGKIILQNITTRWNKRSFSGERSIDTALEAFKLALYSLHIRNGKSSDIARVCMRIAWLYRLKGDSKEKEFLQFALKCYNECYEKERFPIEKFDEPTCIYIIAELNRRLGNYEEAVKWFSKLVTAQMAGVNPRLVKNAREQYYLTREQMGKPVGELASS